jgi:phage terminase small subunit
MADITLKPQHQTFADAYLRTFNATKAAKEAGYSEKTAYSQGSRLLKDVEIQAYVRTRMEEHAMSSTEVLYHLAQIARGDMDDIVDSKGTIDIYKAREAGRTNLIKRIKTKSITTADKDGEGSDIFESETEAYDRMKALELIAKHLGMFTEKIQIEDWRNEAIADIRAGHVTYPELAQLFDDNLAAQLFMQAGVPIQRE